MAIQMCDSQLFPGLSDEHHRPRCNSVTYLATGSSRLSSPRFTASASVVVANNFPTEPRLKIESGCYSFVLRQVGKPVIEKLSVAIHAHRYRNAAAFAVLW